jgi:hypothetical protein
MINNSGMVAFKAFSSFGGGGGGSGIFSGNGGPVTTIKYSGVMTGLFESPSINDSATVVYVQQFNSGLNTVFSYSGGINTPIATSNLSGPLAGFRSPHINSAGDVALLGYYVFQPNEGFGIFTGPDPVADRVLLIGNELFGSTVTDLNLSGGRRLNDTGDIVFGYVLANGVAGIAVAQVFLPGDYNQNGTVDAADYAVWRDNLGTTITLPNDSTPGTVTAADYDVWRAHFGQVPGSGSGARANTAVPEPGSLMLLMFAAAGWCLRRQCAESRVSILVSA